MRKLSILLVLFLALCSCNSVTVPGDVPFDPVYALASNGIPYHAPCLDDTKAPSGYKPFYISHYGRHGSRVYAEDKVLAPVLDILSEGEAAGNLSPMGKEVLDSLRSEVKQVSGLVGQITERGAMEHRIIAERMFTRFPEVFRKGGAVRCVASMFPRCITSMANFTCELKGLAPECEFSYYVGPGFQPYVLCEDFPDFIKEAHAAAVDGVYDALCDRQSMVARFFVNPPSLTDTQAEGICKALYQAWMTCAADDIRCIDLLRYYSESEVRALMLGYSEWYYLNFCKASDNGLLRLSYAGKSMMDVLENARAAISGSGKAADLRFGHDSGITPLMSLMCIEGFETAYDPGDAHNHWNTSEMLPMAANLQLVFYRKRGSDVILVKCLYNEKETAIPALKAVCGPYYDWHEVDAYWQANLDAALAERKRLGY